MKAWIAILFLFIASPLAAQQSVVEQVKADLVRRGVNLLGPCGAFEITKRVAWQLRGQGAGLYYKGTVGENCNGYNVNIVQFAPPNGHWFDILQGAGDVGGNQPRWDDGGVGSGPSVDNGPGWKPAFDPGDAPNPPPPVPVPVPPPSPSVDLSGVYLKLDALYAQAERIFAAEAAADQRQEQQLAAVDAKVQKVYDKPSLLEEILKSPYLYTIVGSILAGRYVIPDK